MSESPPVVPVAIIAKEVLSDEDRSSKSMPPTTTAAQDETLAGQRRVNILWEVTQGIIALSVLAAVIYVETSGRSSAVLNTMAAMIVAAYFARTNHGKIGGVGAKATDNQPYVGR